MTNGGDDVIRCDAEGFVVDDDSFVVHIVGAFLQFFPQVIGMGCLNVDEMVPEVEMQRLGAVLVQPVPRGNRFFQHDERSARHGLLAVEEGAAAREAVDEVELEFVAG